MVQGSFTHTQKDQINVSPTGFDANDNFAFNKAAIFYAGRVFSPLGAFIEGEYDGVKDKVALERADIRLAGQGEAAGQDIVYGASLNNGPAVQDIWNTTPVWDFPFVRSPLAPRPKAAALIDNTLDGQVGGGTLYAMISRFLYLEAGAYTTFAKDVQKGMGTFEPEQNQIDGGAPYWRIVLQHDWNGHYFALGHYALRADVFPDATKAQGPTAARTLLWTSPISSWVIPDIFMSSKALMFEKIRTSPLVEPWGTPPIHRTGWIRFVSMPLIPLNKLTESRSAITKFRVQRRFLQNSRVRGLVYFESPLGAFFFAFESLFVGGQRLCIRNP